MDVNTMTLAKLLQSCLVSAGDVNEFLRHIGSQIFPGRGIDSGGLISRGSTPRLVGSFGLTLSEQRSLTRMLHLEPFGLPIREGNLIAFTDGDDFEYWNPHWSKSQIRSMASLLLPVHFLSEPAVIWFRFDRDFLLKENQTLYEGLELISNALDCIGMKSYLKSVSPVHFGSMHLSDRELQVARLVASGSSNLQVARVLNFSESWVKQLLGQVFVKLDIRSRRELEQLSE